MDVVASIQHAIELAGKLRELSKRLEDAEFKMLLADLSGDLADAKLEVAELKLNCARLTEERDLLQEQLKQRESGKPEIKEGLYAFSGEAGLFCTACFDTKNRKVRVTALSGPFTTFGKWKCPSCTATYSGK